MIKNEQWSDIEKKKQFQLNVLVKQIELRNEATIIEKN